VIVHLARRSQSGRCSAASFPPPHTPSYHAFPSFHPIHQLCLRPCRRSTGSWLPSANPFATHGPLFSSDEPSVSAAGSRVTWSCRACSLAPSHGPEASSLRIYSLTSDLAISSPNNSPSISSGSDRLKRPGGRQPRIVHQQLVIPIFPREHALHSSSNNEPAGNCSGPGAVCGSHGREEAIQEKQDYTCLLELQTTKVTCEDWPGARTTHREHGDAN